MLGALVRRFRDFASAEDALQDALVAASIQWPRDGVPDNPKAWLIQVAARRMTDAYRSDSARRRREEMAVLNDAPFAPDVHQVLESGLLGGEDDALRLLFMCCHPSLTRSSAIALTLRAVGGLTTAEIADAFFVPVTTMAQRISRAKQTIKTSGVGFELPGTRDLQSRLDVVLHVLYLIFNEGYASSRGPTLQRTELTREAIRLARAVHRLRPDECEAAGLLALMLLTDARRAARSGPDDELIPLDRQDRTLWDREAIEEGTALVTATIARGVVGPYQLQAAIAALHDEAPSATETDWPQILALYGLLARMGENPMVRLNQAIAAAMVKGPEQGLRMLEALDTEGALAGHYRLDAVRAHLYELAGDPERAVAHYRTAAEKTASEPERRYLRTQAARLGRPA